MSTFESYALQPKGFAANPELAGRNKSESGNTWQLKALWEHHHVMKRLSVLGWAPKEIARHLNMTPEAVRACLNSEIMRREIDLLRAELDNKTIDIAQRLQDMAGKGCQVLDDILSDDSAPSSLRAKIALDVLSRTGYPMQTNISGQINHTHFTDSEIEQLKASVQREVLPESIVDGEFSAIE